MKYNLLGSTGLAVSQLSFGAMTFGKGTMVPGVVNDIDQNQANLMVDKAIDAGINLFDTADAYTGGQSEDMLGTALKDKRQEVIIATKCGFRMSDSLINRGLSYHHIVQSAENSLKRLKTDYIDIFFLHIPDPHTAIEETLKALDDLQKRGCIRYSGLSNFPVWKAAKILGIQAASGNSKVAVTQMYYSLLGRDLDHDYVPFLEDANLGLMVWSPLASGYLTGKYTGKEIESARRKNFQFPPVDTELGDKVVYKLREIGKSHKATEAQVAYTWLFAKSFVSTVLVGANSMTQLEDNLKATEVTLSADEVAALDEISTTPAPYPAWMQPMAYDQKTVEAIGD